MSDALEDHKGSVSIGGTFINFHFAGDLVVYAEADEKAGDIVTSMVTTCTRYKVKFGSDDTQILTNNPT